MMPIPSMLYNAAVGGHVTNSQQIIDENLNREQQDINEEVTGVPYNASNPNGMGKIVLKKNDNFKQVVEAQTDGNTIFVIKYDFILTGNVLVPANCVLEFDGGSINGNGTGKNTIIGTNTQIIAQAVAILNNGIVIAGTWICARILSDWFSDITLDNRIKQLFNLTNEDIQNTILITENIYNVSVDINNGVALLPNSNTEIILNGSIKMATNAFDSTIIIHIKNCKNVKVHGSGSLIGDKTTHTGTTGEGGDGINITGSENIYIEGITIKDFWGDCIYIGGWDGLNKNINIFGCTLDNGRRQGISVTWAHFVNIKNCTIKNVSGTAPQYGIDLEPNTSCSVRFVWIEGCEITNCYGGIMDYASADNNSEVGDYFVLRNNIHDIISNHAILINGTSQNAHIEENCINGILKILGSKAYVKNNVIEGYFNISGSNNTIKNNRFKLTSTGIMNAVYSYFTENIIEYKDKDNETPDFDQVYVVTANGSFISYNKFTDVKNRYGFRFTDSSNIEKAIFVGNQFYSSIPNDARFLHPNPYKCFKQSMDYPNSGSTANRPTMNNNSYDNSVSGFCYFDTDLKKPIYKNDIYGGWVDALGNDPDAKTSGTFAQKPSNVAVGFRYFCTDKQTTEGATNGIEIIHKGSNVWVDALGRVVS